MLQHIIGLSGMYTGRRFPSGEVAVSFGRSAASTVVLHSRLASRHHAELRREEGSYTLYDHESRHGTFVNGEPIDARTLEPGDMIRSATTCLASRPWSPPPYIELTPVRF